MISRQLMDLVDQFLAIGAFGLGAYKLKLHDETPEAPLSPFYINLRGLRSYPALLAKTAKVLGRVVEGLSFDLLVDIPTAATPIVAVLSVQANKPMISPRLVAKTHGLTGKIDGVYAAGQIALPIDDLVTTAASKIEAIDVLKSNGLVVRDVVVLVDREQGGKEGLAAAGYDLHSAITITQLLNHYVVAELISKLAYDICTRYLRNELPSGWEESVEKGWDQIAA